MFHYRISFETLRDNPKKHLASLEQLKLIKEIFPSSAQNDNDSDTDDQYALSDSFYIKRIKFIAAEWTNFVPLTNFDKICEFLKQSPPGEFNFIFKYEPLTCEIDKQLSNFIDEIEQLLPFVQHQIQIQINADYFMTTHAHFNKLISLFKEKRTLKHFFLNVKFSTASGDSFINKLTQAIITNQLPSNLTLILSGNLDESIASEFLKNLHKRMTFNPPKIEFNISTKEFDYHHAPTNNATRITIDAIQQCLRRASKKGYEDTSNNTSANYSNLSESARSESSHNSDFLCDEKSDNNQKTTKKNYCLPFFNHLVRQIRRETKQPSTLQPR